MGFSTWMHLQLMDALSAVRSERILASQMHLPATLNLQSPNKFVRIQIGRVQTHFKIKMLPRTNLVMQSPSVERSMRNSMLSWLPAAWQTRSRTSEFCWCASVNNVADFAREKREILAWKGFSKLREPFYCIIYLIIIILGTSIYIRWMVNDLGWSKNRQSLAVLRWDGRGSMTSQSYVFYRFKSLSHNVCRKWWQCNEILTFK